MSERIVAVVPIRSLRDGKTRLASVLSPEAREAFLRRSAAGVVRAAFDSGSVETVLVVSPDADVLAWASGRGPRVVGLAQPHAWPGLNGAIAAGRSWARDTGASGLLSIFADLPLLRPADMRGMVDCRAPVVLGPDRREEGTNALLLRFAERGAEFAFAFGQGSLTRHVAEAKRLGLDVAFHATRGIGFDVDTPSDWRDFLGLVADRVAEWGPSPATCGTTAG